MSTWLALLTLVQEARALWMAVVLPEPWLAVLRRQLMFLLFQWVKPPAELQATAAPALKRPTPVFWIMRKAWEGVAAAIIPAATKAQAANERVLAFIIAPPSGRPRTLHDVADRFDHGVEQKALRATGGIGDAAAVGDRADCRRPG